MGFCRCRRMVLCVSRLLAEDGTHSAGPAPPPTRASSIAFFRPGIAVVICALTVMFFLTFLLLLYAKHCKRAGGDGGAGRPASSSAPGAGRRNSGVERAVVQSLPVFRFGALEGLKDGLECAVCLARFETAELLRLLPKCQHAFHVECVDAWLEAHSTCPLCRSRVDPEDVLLLPDPAPDKTRAADPPIGRRISGRHSSAGEKSSGVQIVVHPGDPRWRRSADSVARPATAMSARVRKDGLLLAGTPEGDQSVEQRFGHRIIVSAGGDGALERWSDLRPSELLFLRSEMIMTNSGRYSVSREAEARASRAISSSARCASDIAGLPRRLGVGVGGGGGVRGLEEERTMRRWLGFGAKRTAGWVRSRDNWNGPSG